MDCKQVLVTVAIACLSWAGTARGGQSTGAVVVEGAAAQGVVDALHKQLSHRNVQAYDASAVRAARVHLFGASDGQLDDAQLERLRQTLAASVMIAVSARAAGEQADPLAVMIRVVNDKGVERRFFEVDEPAFSDRVARVLGEMNLVTAASTAQVAAAATVPVAATPTAAPAPMVAVASQAPTAATPAATATAAPASTPASTAPARVTAAPGATAPAAAPAAQVTTADQSSNSKSVNEEPSAFAMHLGGGGGMLSFAPTIGQGSTEFGTSYTVGLGARVARRFSLLGVVSGSTIFGDGATSSLLVFGAGARAENRLGEWTVYAGGGTSMVTSMGTTQTSDVHFAAGSLITLKLGGSMRFLFNSDTVIVPGGKLVTLGLGLGFVH